MPARTDILLRAARLRARFEAAGATAVEPPILQPAEVLLELYGEDIRGRAYVTSDALRGEQMLRPDFTVPVVQMHMADGADPARYTYSGEVFRRQENHPDRASEYIQVGYEVFDGANPAAADAEVFTLIRDALTGLPLRPATGDIGLLLSAVRSLKLGERRRRALMRHVWRPRRFQALLDRFAGRTPPPETRSAMLALKAPLADAGPGIGRRSLADVETRIAALRTDAEEPPLSETELTALEALLSVQETVPFAMQHLRDIAIDLPWISDTLDQLNRRADAMADRGVDVDHLAFEAGYGRASMEYYDGFVFGFHADRRSGLPPIATGGRYDALTRYLGGGVGIPAVGAVLRPDLVLDLEGAPV